MHGQGPPPSAAHSPLTAHSLEGGIKYGIQRSEEKSMFRGVLGVGVSEPDLSFLSETISRIDQQYYIIAPALLLGTPISERKRAVRFVIFEVLRCWMMEEGMKIGMSRNTVASANTILDLFLQKGGEISVEELQVLGITALMLVNKCGCREIKMQIDERVFPKNKLNGFQAKICSKLNFRINPVTYVQVLDELICGWNIFAQKHNDLWYYQSRSSSIKGRTFSTRSMYQLMDTLFLVVRTYTHHLFQLVLEVFRVFLMKDYEAICSLPKPIEDEVIISFWNNPEEEPLLNSSFQTLFRTFINFIQSFTSPQSMVEVCSNREIQLYVHSFLMSGFEAAILRETANEAQNDRQSINPCSLKVGRMFVSFKKNYRKSSGETLAP